LIMFDLRYHMQSVSHRNNEQSYGQQLVLALQSTPSI